MKKLAEQYDYDYSDDEEEKEDSQKIREAKPQPISMVSEYKTSLAHVHLLVH